MAKKQRKPALYEVICKSRQKTVPAVTAEPLRKSLKDGPEDLLYDEKMQAEPLEWPKKRKLIWFSNNKVEISIAYSLAVAILLGVISLVLFAFQLGQLAGAN